MPKDTRHVGILYIGAAIGFTLFVSGVTIGVLSPTRIEPLKQLSPNGIVAVERPAFWPSVGSIVLQALGAAVLFPILVSFAYDRFRERWLGDEVWRLFGELADAGITRVYKDREFAPGRDNAETRLSEEFRQFSSGEVCLMGPSLRVFFNVLGTFHHDIENMLVNGHGNVHIRALIERDDSQAVRDRTGIEEPSLIPSEEPQTQRDARATVAAVRGITKRIGSHIALRRFLPAPYCTAIIFPHVVYFSPNLLAPVVPVRLPMILFRSGSHGYDMLRLSFEHLWTHPETIQVVPEAITD